MPAYVVSYRRYEDEKFYSANLVWAESYKDIQREFDGCDWFCAHIAPEWEVRECRTKGMPERRLQDD